VRQLALMRNCAFLENWVEHLFLYVLPILGAVASVVGAWLTIRYSKAAQSAAVAARSASQETRRQVYRLDSLYVISEASRLMSDLGNRIESKSWEMVEERSSSIRLLILPIADLLRKELSLESSVRLSDLLAQLQQMSQTASKVRYSEIKEPSVGKMRRLMDTQKETLTVVMAELKAVVGGENDQHI